MTKHLDDLSAYACDLTRASIACMDNLWDIDLGLLRSMEDGPKHRVRASAWYALGLLLRNEDGDQDRACTALHSVLDNQFDEPGTAYHGTFYRAPEEPHPRAGAERWRGYDPNWRQFIGTTLAVILDEYENDLPDALVKRIDESISKAVVGESEEARLSPHYTNIALMRAPLDVWAGKRYNRSEWVERGEDWAKEIYRLFREHNSFDEYSSPTYYGVDLYALGFWRTYAPSDLLCEMGKAMEAEFWRDIAAHYHAGLKNLCGPYFRSYGMDMRNYVAILGQAIWMAVGREKAPHPDPAGPMGHTGDIAFPPCLAAVGVHIPEDVLSSFQAFPSEHTVEKVITDSPHVVATSWLGEQYMVGGAYTSATRDAAGQFHPATVHWLAPDGTVAWVRMARGSGVDATAAKGSLSISCSGNPAFQIYAPGADVSMLTKTRWELPGLTVAVETDTEDWQTAEVRGTLEITYPGAARIELGI